MVLCFIHYSLFVVSSISLFEEKSVRPDVILVCSDKVLALVVDVVDLDDLCVLHVYSVLDEDLVARPLILESGGEVLGQCRVRGAVDTCSKCLYIYISYFSWEFVFLYLLPLPYLNRFPLSRLYPSAAITFAKVSLVP